MYNVKTWQGTVNEDGTFSILARVCSLDGTGTQVSSKEGACLTQADVTSITCKVFDLGTDENNTAGVEITPAPTLVVATSIFDTLRTVGWPTTDDGGGYNFRHDVDVAFTADSNEYVLLEYKFTLVVGGIAWLKVRVFTDPVQTS